MGEALAHTSCRQLSSSSAADGGVCPGSGRGKLLCSNGFSTGCSCTVRFLINTSYPIYSLQQLDVKSSQMREQTPPGRFFNLNKCHFLRVSSCAKPVRVWDCWCRIPALFSCKRESLTRNPRAPRRQTVTQKDTLQMHVLTRKFYFQRLN